MLPPSFVGILPGFPHLQLGVQLARAASPSPCCRPPFDPFPRSSSRCSSTSLLDRQRLSTGHPCPHTMNYELSSPSSLLGSSLITEVFVFVTPSVCVVHATTCSTNCRPTLCSIFPPLRHFNPPVLSSHYLNPKVAGVLRPVSLRICCDFA